MLSLPGGAASLRLWSAEQPHLYLLLLSLSSSGGGEGGGRRVLEWEACQVGCRGWLAGWHMPLRFGTASGRLGSARPRRTGPVPLWRWPSSCIVWVVMHLMPAAAAAAAAAHAAAAGRVPPCRGQGAAAAAQRAGGNDEGCAVRADPCQPCRPCPAPAALPPPHRLLPACWRCCAALSVAAAASPSVLAAPSTRQRSCQVGLACCWNTCGSCPPVCCRAGVNRHEHDQLCGKTVSLEGMVQVQGCRARPSS